MNKQRKFTLQFKSQVVLKLLSGERSMAELCHAHQLTAQQLLSYSTVAEDGDLRAAVLDLAEQYPT